MDCLSTVSLPKPIYILQWTVAIATGPSSLSVATPVGVGYSSEAGTVITPSHSMEAKLVPDLGQLMRPGLVTPSTVQVSNSNRVKMGQKQLLTNYRFFGTARKEIIIQPRIGSSAFIDYGVLHN